MPASGEWFFAARLRSPQPGGSISVYEPGAQLEETTVASTGGTVAQIRVELEDHTAGVGDDPVVNLNLWPAQGNFTVNTGTDVITTGSDHGRVVGDVVTFTSTGTLPSGLSAGTDYYVVEAAASNTMKVSTTPGGTAVDITTAGSGTHSWRGYGQIAPTYEYGGGTSNVAAAENLDGEDNDFDLIRGIHAKLSRNDPDTAAASAQVIVELGDPADKMAYVYIPLAFDIDDETDSVGGVIIPSGVAFSPAYPLKITIVASDNAQLLLSLQGT